MFHLKSHAVSNWLFRALRIIHVEPETCIRWVIEEGYVTYLATVIGGLSLAGLIPE
jgi:hypothetical protein